jgi:starch-binding outer membrane protein, SusD/RagB family
MNKYKFLSIIIIFFIAVSCKKAFLERAPISTVSVDVLYKTDKDFQDAVTGTYSALMVQYQNFWMFGDLRSDDSKHEIPSNVNAFSMDNFTIGSDNSLLKDTWRNYYQVINRANTVLDRIKKADISVVKNKAQYIGEAKFLRALAYFDLIRIFGDVPMITTEVQIEEAYKIGREKLDTIYDEVIIKDLLDAENNLPLKYGAADIGRATKGAAKSLLGKVYLTRKDFVKAEAKLQEVTTMGYALLSKFSDLFDYTKNEHHSEYIFDIEYEEGMGLGSNFTNTFIPNSVQMAAYYKVSGGRGESNSVGDSLFTLYTPQDTRKDITIAIKGGWIDGNGVFVPLLPTTSQSYTKKYLTPVATGNDSRANWKVIRYADVLLMYAEALNENGKTTEALVQLNKIRSRAGVPTYSNLSQSDTREKIYLERRLELAFEGHRWFDLLRTGRALKVMQPYGMQPYMTVFPIPISQIQLINDASIFPQNPGY